MNRFVRAIAVLLLVVFCFTLVACKKNEAVSAQAGAVVFNPVVFETDKYKLTVIGGEKIKDSNNNDAIRIYYDFENKYEVPTAANEVVYLTAVQDGAELTKAYPGTGFSVPETQNYSMRVYRDVKIRCTEQFSCKADGGKITVQVSENANVTNVVNVDFDMNALPGTPKDAVLNNYVIDEAHFDYLNESGVVDDYYDVKVLESERVKAADGSDAIRIYFDFKNNSDYNAAFWSTVGTKLVVSQDGVQLQSVISELIVTEDDNYSADVKKGGTTKVSKCFKLRSDSPVCVEIIGFYSDDIGKVFS